MIYSPELKPAVFLRRYKRFLADVILDDREITVHCPNTGSMQACLVEGSQCYLSDSNNPKRKYRYTLELVTSVSGHFACVNTLRANTLVAEGIDTGLVAPLAGYCEMLREQKYGEGSRIDILLLSGCGKRCFVEIKSVTLEIAPGEGFFPDAVSSRGQKHLQELMLMRRQGHRAVLFFCVQHEGIRSVAPADHIDPVYGQLLRQAVNAGVEVMAYKSRLSAEQLVLTEAVPVVLV
ncbi:sugar fermentation stimulation protein A [Alteromonadaceae bacterium Bs31]|nr:sugar fermentation stimulation protein A [Alteromonadaceae bacterium Bs31]